MLIRSALASAVLAAVTTGCTPTPQAPKAVISDKTYAVAPGAITSFAQRRAVNPVVRGIGRRSLTIYLWHSAAAILNVSISRVASPFASLIGLPASMHSAIASSS